MAHPADHTTWMPGAREATVALRTQRLALAVVTNKDRTVTEAVLAALAARDDFSAVWGAGDGALKPAPDGPLAAMKALGVDASETWMVGDGAQDVGAARAAGCRAIALLGGFHSEARLREARPDALLGSMRELVALVDSSLA
jgi:phosphoglycolate phosphatase